jgi:hypothetical protein
MSNDFRRASFTNSAIGKDASVVNNFGAVTDPRLDELRDEIAAVHSELSAIEPDPSRRAELTGLLDRVEQATAAADVDMEVVDSRWARFCAAVAPAGQVADTLAKITGLVQGLLPD